jgi:hypothetical protein
VEDFNHKSKSILTVKQYLLLPIVITFWTKASYILILKKHITESRFDF